MNLAPEERQAFIDEISQGDTSLYRKLAELVDVASQEITAGNFSRQHGSWGQIQDGDKVGKYTILSKLGGGGMGVVYRAEDRRLQRIVALKFLAPELTRDPEAKTRFIQEAQAASALEHPNICTIYEADETPDGITYIAMPCYEGQTLKQKLSGGALSVDVAQELARQIGNGLKKAHSKNIVHRDIKPANIMVVSEGEQETIKILDFGLAKVSDVSITRTGSTIGTVAYMSPEQARGEAVDHRTDIFSVGAILYEMLTGQRPFPGGFEHAVTYQLLYEPHKPLTDLRPDLPHELEFILDRALEKEADDRYQTIYDFLEDLSSLTKQDKLKTSTSSPVKPSRALWDQKSRALVAGVVGIVFLTALGFFLFKSSPTPQAVPASNAEHKQITFTGTAYDPGISPDGSMVAYYAKELDETGSLVLQDLSGGQSLTLLSGITARSEFHSFIKWSSDGTLLAVNTEIEGKQGIYIIPRLGGQPRVIETNSTSLFHDWSPDGNTLVVTYDGGKFLTFIDVKTLAGTAQELDDVYDFPKGISWSRAANKIALLTTSDNYSRFEIWLVDPDGSGQQVVVQDSVRLSSPRWGPAGERLFYLRGDLDMELWEVDTQLSKNASPQLVQKGLKEGMQFSVSDDQKRLVYYSNLKYQNLWLMGTEGQTAVKLTRGTARIWDPHISHDNQYIAFVMQNTSGGDVFTIPLTGGNIEQRTFLPRSASQPTWSFDDTKLAFGSFHEGRYKVWSLDTQTQRTKVYENAILSGYVAWLNRTNLLYQLPGNKNFGVLDTQSRSERPLVANDSIGWMFSPAVSPDGKHVAVYWNRLDRKRGVWVISLEDGTQKLVKGFDNFVDSLRPIRWSEDGRWIYATYINYTPQEIVRVSLDGIEQHVIATIPGSENANVDISSNGKHIVASLPEEFSDIWVMEGGLRIED